MLGDEAGAIDPIDCHQCAIGPPPKHQGDDKPVAGLEAEPAEAVLLKVCAVELVCEPL